MLNSDLKKSALNQLKKASEQYASIGENVQNDAIKLLEIRNNASVLIRIVEEYINTLAHTPKSFASQFEKVNILLNKFRALLDIKYDEKMANTVTGGISGAGVAAGIGIAAFGPTAALAVATTFGTASTGVAISSLTGAAATNAALAWLGGGAVVAGGGGMAGGSTLLALAGPIGWGIGGAALVTGAVVANKKNKKIAVKAQKETVEIVKQISVLQGVNLEIEELKFLTEEHSNGLFTSLDRLKKTDVIDYLKFTEMQKQELGALVNNTYSLSELINKKVGA